MKLTGHKLLIVVIEVGTIGGLESLQARHNRDNWVSTIENEESRMQQANGFGCEWN